MQLLNGERVRDLLRCHGSIWLPIHRSHTIDCPLYGGKRRALWERSIAQMIVSNGDSHQAIGWHDELVWRISRPILLHPRLIDDDIQVHPDMLRSRCCVCNWCGLLNSQRGVKGEIDA